MKVNKKGDRAAQEEERSDSTARHQRHRKGRKAAVVLGNRGANVVRDGARRHQLGKKGEEFSVET